jgi:hypothetical protein
VSLCRPAEALLTGLVEVEIAEALHKGPLQLIRAGSWFSRRADGADVGSLSVMHIA